MLRFRSAMSAMSWSSYTLVPMTHHVIDRSRISTLITKVMILMFGELLW